MFLPPHPRLRIKYIINIHKSWLINDYRCGAVESLDLVVILRDIHTFYIDFPPHMWESSSQDVPMRTVKTVVYSIVSHKPHGGVLEALYQIPSAVSLSLPHNRLMYTLTSILDFFLDFFWICQSIFSFPFRLILLYLLLLSSFIYFLFSHSFLLLSISYLSSVHFSPMISLSSYRSPGRTSTST